MKKLTMAMTLIPMITLAETLNDEATGITWTYRVNNGKSQAIREKENEPKSFCGFKFGDATYWDRKTNDCIAWNVSELKSRFRYFKRAELWMGAKSGRLYGITMRSEECPQRELDAEFDVVSKIIESKYGIPPERFTRESDGFKKCDANVFRIGDVNIEVIRFFRYYDSPMNDFTKIAGDEVQDREMLVNTWSPGLAIRVIHTRLKHEVVGEVRKFSANAGAEVL